MKKRRAAKNASPLLSVLIVVFFLLVFLGSRYLSSQPAPAARRKRRFIRS